MLIYKYINKSVKTTLIYLQKQEDLKNGNLDEQQNKEKIRLE